MNEKRIGSFIAVLRKAKGMTQKELAELLNVSDKAVSRWEREESMPDISLIPLIADIFEVTCDELLRGERILHERPEESEEKRERRLRQLLKNRKNRYLTLSLIPVGLSLLGILTAAFINFVLQKGGVAFYAALAAFLIAGLLQTIFFFYFKGETDTEELSGDALLAYQKSLKDHLWKILGLLLVLTGFCLPLLFLGQMDLMKYLEMMNRKLAPEGMSWTETTTDPALSGIHGKIAVGISFVTWFVYGSIGAVIAGFLCFGACILRNKKPVLRLLRKDFLFLVVTLTVTAAGAGIFWKVMPECLAKGTEFTSYEAFQEYMETPAADMSASTIALRRQLDKYHKVLYGAQGEVLCEYTALNDEVVRISYGKDSMLPITTYTEADRQKAQQKTESLLKIWWLLMCAEVTVEMVRCKKKIDRQ